MLLAAGASDWGLEVVEVAGSAYFWYVDGATDSDGSLLLHAVSC